MELPGAFKNDADDLSRIMIFNICVDDVTDLIHFNAQVQCEWWSQITVDKLVGYDR